MSEQFSRKIPHPETKAPPVPDVYTNIWNLYRSYRNLDEVIRSGFGLYGCYPYDPNQGQSGAHPESVSEHTGSTVYLMMLLATFLPSLFTRTHLPPEPGQSEITVILRAWRLCFFLMHHDSGEAAYGDRPDDGSQNVAEKDAFETKNLQDLAQNLPAPARVDLLNDFRQFLDPKKPTLLEDSDELYVELIQLARLCDKFDAVLKAIHFESLGVVGHMSYKIEHFGSATDRDHYFAELAHGDDSTAAIWTTHLASDYSDYFGFRELLNLTRAAVIDVRGSWFPWWPYFCERTGFINPW